MIKESNTFLRKTRKERSLDKRNSGIVTNNASLAIFSLYCDINVAFAIRIAACYGLKNIYNIGAKPDKAIHDRLSGSNFDNVIIQNFQNTNEFLQHCRDVDAEIVSAELCDGSTNIYDFGFNPDKEVVIVIGNETFGVPGEIIHNSKPVFIPMNGPGVCLNTVIAGSIIVDAYFRQMYDLRQ